jgi:hypothetical protein
MTRTPPMIHMVMVDIAPEQEAAFNDWYETVHIPQILACPGWRAATRRLVDEGGPKYAALYEIDGPEAYDTPEFNAIKGFGPFAEFVANFRRIRLKPIPGRSCDWVVAS